MPASVYTDMNANSSGLEDHRTLQIAMELSMLGLNGEDEGPGINNSSFEDGLRKSSTNMTECVPVPSSEHVAEIVGRQGCKIKALRAKTNTYIKTPVRGEEPVFVVTGRREDVGSAKREILSAAEHFSQIRASRRNNSVSSISSTGSNLTPGPPSPSAPGQVTIQVRVPYRVVGLVVGPKGATIKRIQQQTHTYIVTPSRDKEPVFEVTGLPENVEKARQEIESHIAMRTGGMVDAHLDDGDFQSNGVDSGFHELNSDMVGSIYKMSNSNSPYTTYSNNSNNLLSRQEQETIFNFPPVNESTKITDFVPLTNGFSGFNGFSIYDNDEGIASPSFDSTANSHSLWSELGDNQNDLVSTIFGTASTAANLPRRSSSLGGSCTTPRLSPTLTDSSSTSNINAASGDHPMVRRIRSDPLSGGLASLSSFSPLPNSNYASTSGASSTSSSPTDSTGSGSHIRRSCLLCSDSMVVAALVPCGHNLFCMECANLIMDKPAVERSCPVCQQTPTQAIRIFS